MRVFFLLGRTFLDQSLAIAKEFRSRYHDSEFMALIAARRDTLKFVEEYKDPKFKHIKWLNDLEEQALKTPLDKNKLEYYRKTLGNDALKRLIISDRELGFGYLTGGVYARTPLINATKYDDEKRWSVVVALLDYLFEAFEREKPDFVFSYCIAAAHELAMQVVAKHMGIVFVQPTMVQIGNYFIMDDNAYPDLTVVQHSFKKLLNKEIEFPESLEKARKFLDEFRNKPAAPEYNNRIKKIVEAQAKIPGMLKTLAVDAARFAAIKLGLFGTKGVLRQRNGFDILTQNLSVFCVSRRAIKGKEFEDYETFKNTDYIYYTLHLDPEAATIVMAPYHTDQLAVIEAISKQMPAGMKLIVKEHLPSIGKRPHGFYERIRSIPGVHLISPFANSFSIMEKAKLTCVITGTAGKEAILLGKPALIIGHVHFNNLGDDIVRCGNLADMGTAIERAMNKEPVNKEKLLTYISAIMEEGFETSANEIWQDKNYNNIPAQYELAKTITDKMLRLREVVAL